MLVSMTITCSYLPLLTIHQLHIGDPPRNEIHGKLEWQCSKYDARCDAAILWYPPPRVIHPSNIGILLTIHPPPQKKKIRQWACFLDVLAAMIQRIAHGRGSLFGGHYLIAALCVRGKGAARREAKAIP